MLVLTMELWPFGVEANKRVIAKAKIVNDASGDERTGNYDVTLFNGNRRWKSCRVEGFPRKKLIGWDLLFRALRTMLANRNADEKSSDCQT